MSESECASLQEKSQEGHSSLDQVDQSLNLNNECLKEIILKSLSNKTQEPEKDSSTTTKHPKRQSPSSPQFEAFQKIYDEQPTAELKLQLAIDFMEASLAQGGNPHFQSFWEVRRYCLPLFKENIPLPLRGLLWAKYSELSKEARRLKEILDEQSTFAVEQIEIAIAALETGITDPQKEDLGTDFPEELIFPDFLKNHRELYQALQKQLNLLNVQASHINALRKELLKTEMRIRQKNKFFQRLSTAGDAIFPKRKELIQQISARFSEDVDLFINIHFGTEASDESLYILREEIKSLQSLAKVLTLNTHSFTETRARLSDCWDRIKGEEKERKKDRAQKRVVFKQNAEALHLQLKNLQEQIEKHEIAGPEAIKKLDGITLQMRKVELGREELKTLRDILVAVRKQIQENVKNQEEARLNAQNERLRLKKEAYLSFKNQTENLLENHESLSVDQLASARDGILAQLQESSLVKMERQEIERLIKPLRDIISDKKEKALLDLSDDDRQKLLQLHTILRQRKERRSEIKAQIEALRKSSNSSSLDFEKAINLNSQMAEEKDSLDKVNLGIQEIESNIKELQSKITDVPNFA